MSKAPGFKVAAKRKRRRVGVWLDLFDPALMERVCDLVREAALGVGFGLRPAIVDQLRERLIDVLFKYIDAHPPSRPGGVGIHTRAAAELIDVTEAVCSDLETRAGFDDVQARELGRRLRCAWIEFIAMGAAPLMYDNVRKAAEIAAAAGRLGGRPAQKKQRVLDVARRLQAAGSTLPHELAGKVANQVGCSPDYVRKVLSAPPKRQDKP